MKYRVTSECSKLIRNILRPNPQERPSVSEILNSEYVLQMSKKFNWDLKKLMKFRKMKNNNLSNSMISGMSYQTNNTSQSDSFYFDKRMSGFSTLIENKDLSSEKNKIIASFSSSKPSSEIKANSSAKNIVQNEGMILNFEKKSSKDSNNIFKKQITKKQSQTSNKDPDKFFIEEVKPLNSKSNNFSNEKKNNKSNVFSQKNSEEKHSQVVSQNISQNISQIKSKKKNYIK